MSSPSKFTIHDESWAQDLAVEFSDYMENCAALIFDDPAPDFVPESGEDYCGCEVCEAREALFFLIPRILAAYKEGKVNLA